MTDIQKKAIRQIVQTPSWSYVEEVIREELLEGRKPINFKTEGKTSEMIAIEVMAREMSAKIIDKALKRIKIIGAGKDIEYNNDYKQKGIHFGSSPKLRQISPLIGDATKGLNKTYKLTGINAA